MTEKRGSWDEAVPLDGYADLPSEELEMGGSAVEPLQYAGDVFWASAESFRTADGSLLYEVGGVLQEARGVFLEDRAFVELEPGMTILAQYNHQQGDKVRARRFNDGHPGGQDWRVRLGIWRKLASSRSR